MNATCGSASAIFVRSARSCFEIGVPRAQRERARHHGQLLLDESRVEADPLRDTVDILPVLGHELEECIVGGRDTRTVQHLERPVVDQVFVGLLEHREAHVARERLDAIGHQTTCGIVSASAS
jgi:hypothetical protein